MASETVIPNKQNGPATLTEKSIEVVQTPPAVNPPSDEQLTIYDFFDWLEKLDPNTLVWQIVIVSAVVYFGSALKSILKGLVAKIPQIKNFAGVEFELSDETTSVIQSKEDELNQELEPYMMAIGENPSLLFLNHFIDFERSLDKLYWEAFPNARDFMRESPEKMLKDLVHGEYLSHSAMGAFYDIRKIRNEIVHGKHAFSDVEEARPYLKAVFFLKDLVSSGLEKQLSAKKASEGQTP
jgi:hypothetical protein